MEGEVVNAATFASHLDVGDDVVVGALFLTYGLDVTAFEELVLPRLFALRHLPGESLFAEEARRRLAEVPVAVVADASRLELAASAAAEADPDADVIGGSNCGVPVVRFVQGSGAFHPKLALLACKQRGLRVVIGSANLTRAGMTHQIELVSSFWLTEHPGATGGLRTIVKALRSRLSRSPAFLRAAAVIERALPKQAPAEASAAILCSTTSILDQALARIHDHTGGKGRVTDVSVTSPFFERRADSRTLFEEVDARIRKKLPRTRDVAYELVMPTESSRAPYRVEAPIDRLRTFAQTGSRSLTVRVMTRANRAWTTDPTVGEETGARDRRLHGKLVVLRVQHTGTTSIYTLIGSPNFTKAALLGGNFEIALLQKTKQAIKGLNLSADEVSLDELVEDQREFKSPPRETACIDRIVQRRAEGRLDVIAVEDVTLPDNLTVRARGQVQTWRREGPNAVVRPFDAAPCPIVEVRFATVWYPLPVEVADPEFVTPSEVAPLSLTELLARSTEHAQDPEGEARGRKRGPRGKPDGQPKAAPLASIMDVAEKMKHICDLAPAIESSLGDTTPEATVARFRTYFEPALRALARNVTPAEVSTHAFALLDVRRALGRLRAASADKARSIVIDDLVVTCDELLNDLVTSSKGEDRAKVEKLTDCMGGS